jgi:hypothetical protein
MPLYLPGNGSVFVVLRKPATAIAPLKDEGIMMDTLQNSWMVSFDSTKGGPTQPIVFQQLKDWSTDNNNAIKYYSGTAVYSTTIDFQSDGDLGWSKVWLDVGNVANMAGVYVNGKSCGVAWTAPYRVDITKALRRGENELRIEVTNTWFNRLKGDLLLPEKERITKTNAPFWAKDKPLLPAGLLGPVVLITKY